MKDLSLWLSGEMNLIGSGRENSWKDGWVEPGVEQRSVYPQAVYVILLSQSRREEIHIKKTDNSKSP